VQLAVDKLSSTANTTHLRAEPSGTVKTKVTSAALGVISVADERAMAQTIRSKPAPKKLPRVRESSRAGKRNKHERIKEKRRFLFLLFPKAEAELEELPGRAIVRVNIVDALTGVKTYPGVRSTVTWPERAADSATTTSI